MYSEPFAGLSKNIHKRLADHQNKNGTIHQKTISLYDNFMKVLKGEMLAIKDQVKFKLDQVIFNQSALKSIIQKNIFCGRQALSLHGHRVDPQFYYSSLLEFTNVIVGNFLKLIRFQDAASDGILKRIILKVHCNAKYMSKTIQNELICLCGTEIVTGIISEVKDSRVFSILADEVGDSSNTDQISFVIWFIDKSYQIREGFIEFLECKSGTFEQELYLKIFNFIRDLGLEIDNLRGQVHDGAGIMAGKKVVYFQSFKIEWLKALYVHCFNRLFNLVIAISCNIQKLRNLMGSIKEISYFYNLSPKIEQFLKDVKNYLMPILQNKSYLMFFLLNGLLELID